MKRRRWIFEGAFYVGTLASIGLLLKDMPAEDRAVFLELLKLLVPFVVAGIIGLILLLFAVGLAVEGVIYVTKYALANRPKRKFRPSRDTTRPVGGPRERQITQGPIEPEAVS